MAVSREVAPAREAQEEEEEEEGEEEWLWEKECVAKHEREERIEAYFEANADAEDEVYECVRAGQSAPIHIKF
jgi:hypothetical protein